MKNLREWWAEIDWDRLTCTIIGHAWIEDAIRKNRYRCRRCSLAAGFTTGAAR